MDTFLASLDAGNTPFLDQIEREALETNVPVIRTQTQGLLRFLLAMRRQERRRLKKAKEK